MFAAELLETDLQIYFFTPFAFSNKFERDNVLYEVYFFVMCVVRELASLLQGNTFFIKTKKKPLYKGPECTYEEGILWDWVFVVSNASREIKLTKMVLGLGRRFALPPPLCQSQLLSLGQMEKGFYWLSMEAFSAINNIGRLEDADGIRNTVGKNVKPHGPQAQIQPLFVTFHNAVFTNR